MTSISDVSERDSRSSLPMAAGEAWRLMRDITHRPEVLRRTHPLAEAAGITPGLGRALALLAAEPSTSMRDLALALKCDNSYITTVVDGLEAKGLARRTAHPTDRRVKVIELTPEGQELGQRLQAAMDEPPAAFAALSEAETNRLLALLRKLSG